MERYKIRNVSRQGCLPHAVTQEMVQNDRGIVLDTETLNRCPFKGDLVPVVVFRGLMPACHAWVEGKLS